MVDETILQNWVFTKFVLPFLLIFFVVFGILEKTKLFGADKKQLNALIAFVVGLIFVAAVFPKLVVANLILFLTIGLVVMFVGLLLWGFVAGEEGLKFEKIPTGLKYFIGIAIVVALIFALIWAVGFSGVFFTNAFDFLFRSSWSKDFWTNFAFIAVVIIAFVLALGKKAAGK